MKENIQNIAEEAGIYVPMFDDNNEDNAKLEKFAELIAQKAFRAGLLYAAKKYENYSQDSFTGSDVAMFLEMESFEVTNEEITDLFDKNEESEN